MGQIERFKKRFSSGFDVLDERRLLQVRRVNFDRPIPADDLGEPVQLGVVDHEARIDGFGVGDDAEAQAGWAAAVGRNSMRRAFFDAGALVSYVDNRAPPWSLRCSTSTPPSSGPSS